ncbi:DUF7524 family protein [Natrinema salaciae]|uniref:Uncharacterized protein n=1 Tax=Natrinema salaciae TaxID=1186196 RepID=A0A1H9G9E1_9EURY|nr:hypothetical protein [Natrinema salaciae]SEQ46737.1 hypothetical protein SAMN04489841_1818 [Natrinema salaciae]
MSGTEVTVHVNRRAADALEVATDALETSESFALHLTGHETPAHVHCRLDGDLERIASVDGSNHYVEPDAVTAVPVTVDTDAVDAPVDGRLEVLTGYGSESVSIAVTVVPGPPGVDVDERLAEPRRPDPDPTPLERILDRVSAVSGLDAGALAVLALGVVAVGIAAVTTATIGGPVATAGIAVVVAGLLVALFLLVR